MKRLTCAALLAFTFVVPAAAAQDSGSAKAQKAGAQPAERAAKQRAKEGTDCAPNRAGVRCSRPKPKKVWFFGKA
ncbi:MAG TPA: hypothetical protein VE642_05130 [Pyrinomonadaceae bacterium]|jgi:hypothetical protein|nr:hypothetical protein [Pyrinomonadaceae bacterium]